jgi:hypothetical protein
MAAVATIVLLTACSNTTKITRTYLDETRVGTPVRNVLIIAIIDNTEVREIFETHFMKRLNAAGIEAVTSARVLPIDADSKHKKEAIVRVIDQYDSDTVVITHLVGLEDSEVFNRANRTSRRFYSGYFPFYNYAWDYVHAPTVYGDRVKIGLETRLYDVKTEALIWAGESQTSDPETIGQAIGQVVDVVMDELKKSGLLPEPE